MSGFWHSSIGKKTAMAVTGVVLVGFVVLHLADNLTIYLGPERFNAFAAQLQRLGPLLWLLRAGLLAAVLLHIHASILVTVENRRARPIGYRVQRVIQTTYAARTMIVSGLLLVAFITYHLLHFTFRVTNPDVAHLMDAQGRHNVYAMVVLSFRHLPIAASYVVAMGCLAMHLSHGIASAFQTLGLTTQAWIPRLTRLSHLAAFTVFLGYTSIPLSVVLGVLSLPAGMR